MWVKETNLNVRKEPNTKSQILGTLKKGYIVKVISTLDGTVKLHGRQGSWKKIHYPYLNTDGTVGYVFDAFLVEKEAGPEGLDEKASKLY